MKKGVINYDLELSIRLDKYLSDQFSDLSRTRIKSAIKKGSVFVNGESEKPSYLLVQNDVIKYEFLVEIKVTEVMEAVEMDLDILYEDDAIICLNKPAGLVVHPGAGNKTNTLANGLLSHFRSLSNVNGDHRPGIVHRLDKDTTGVMIVAKTNEAHYHLANQFQNRSVEKTYQAVTWGEWKTLEGVLSGAISRKKSDPTTFTVSKEGRNAETHYEVVSQNRYFSLLTFKPKTGRTHQIRVHACEENHPIFCDQSYGGGLNRTRGFLSEVGKKIKVMMNKMGRHALHAEKISLIHPTTKKPINFTAPYPEDMLNLIEAIRDFDG